MSHLAHKDKPTDADLATTRWVLLYLIDTCPQEAFNSLAVLESAMAEVPATAAEMEEH